MGARRAVGPRRGNPVWAFPRSALYKWKEQLSEQGEDAFQGLGFMPAGPPDELTRLKKELADVKMERNILKKAQAYFARERK